MSKEKKTLTNQAHAVYDNECLFLKCNKKEKKITKKTKTFEPFLHLSVWQQCRIIK